jgi:hypothetical protein
MRHRDVALARLVMVDVSWSEWSSQTDKDKYIGLVKKFLLPSPETCSADPAYIHLCYEKEAPSVSVDPPNETAWVDQQVPYELPPWDDCSNPSGWFSRDNGNTGGWFPRDDGLNQAISVLEKECPPASRAGRLAIHDVPGWGKLFRTRIFMDADRYRAVTGYGGDASYWALIDMRFQEITEHLVLWHTSLSIWSSLPWSPHHCPPDIRKGISQEKSKVLRGLSAVDVAWLIRDFRLHSRYGFRNELMSDMERSELRVFDRLYEPPSFLIAVRGPRARGWPSGHGLQTWGNRHYGEPDILRKVADEVLWTQYYESLPCALLRGGIKPQSTGRI